MATTFHPHHDRILVERLEDEGKIGGGLKLPAGSKERPNRGIVRVVGPGRVTEAGLVVPTGYAAGDVVLFGKYAGTDIELDGKKYAIMRSDEVFGTVVDDSSAPTSA